jgi:thiol-disulfide isomerase/thioredoxin
MTTGPNPAAGRPALARWALYGVAATAGLAVSLWVAYRAGELGPAEVPRSPVGAASPTLSNEITFHRQARALPPLRFADGAGTTTRLADFRGRMVLLNVWATWCTPCREEMPALDRLQARLGGPDFEVVALSIDQAGPSIVQDFFREVGIARLQEYRDQYRETATVVGLTAVPLTLLVDRDGREIMRKLGAAAWDDPKLVAQLEAKLGRTAAGR